MPETPNIAAIILQYGHWQKTRDCVESLLAGDMRPRFIIVVDNASPDDSRSRIEGYLAKRSAMSDEVFPGFFSFDGNEAKAARNFQGGFILAAQKSNRGYAAGNNAGLRIGLALGCEAFLILNNDTVVEPPALFAMWKRLGQCPRPGLCGATIAHDRGEDIVQCLAGGHTSHFSGLSTFAGAGLSLEEAKKINPADVEKKLNFICGACVMASREFVEKAGLMDEGYFLYCEEQDWALAARGQFDLAFAPDALVRHYEGASTGWSRYDFSWRRCLTLARSRLRLAWRHYPRHLPFVSLCIVFSAGRLCLRKMAHGAREKLKRLVKK